MNKELSYIDKLLNGAEVEWKKLGDVAEFLKGKGLSKKEIIDNGENLCIHYGELFTQYPTIINRIKSSTNRPLANSVLSKMYDVLMPTSDVTPNGLATASCVLEDNVVLGGDILIIRTSIIDGRFLSYFIRNNKNKILQMVSGSTVFHIYAKDLAKFQIPIPPLSVQKEIVRILDKFTELTTELTAELAARKKQYEYYRGKLLNFNDICNGGGGITY